MGICSNCHCVILLVISMSAFYIHFSQECTRQRMFKGVYPSIPFISYYDTVKDINCRQNRIKLKAKGKSHGQNVIMGYGSFVFAYYGGKITLEINFPILLPFALNSYFTNKFLRAGNDIKKRQSTEVHCAECVHFNSQSCGTF